MDKEIGIYNIKGQKANKYHNDIDYKDCEIYILARLHKQKNKILHQNINHNHP